MDPNPQSLCSSFPCTAANGRRGPKQPSNSPEIGDARPKPPVKPKPCVLPKPAMPVKPVPGLRQTLSEVPSAEKINLLAGPKPYSGAGHTVKRLCFNLKTPPREATNGKEVLSPFSTTARPSGEGEIAEPAKKSSAVEGASGEQCGESSSTRKGIVPFRVKPVPVATKPERFPGITVEEILAKMEKPNKEGASSPDRPRLVRSFFSQDGSAGVNLGPKGYTAFRRCSSGGEAGETESEGPVYRASREVEESRLSRNKEEITSSNGQHLLESEQLGKAIERNLDFLCRDSSSRPSMRCDGGQPGYSSPQFAPGVFLTKTYRPHTNLFSGVAPGSPDAPAEPTQPPGAPHFPADAPSTEAQLPPGSPDAPNETLGSPVEISLSLTQAPGSPVAHADPYPSGSPSGTINIPLGHSSLSSGFEGLSIKCPDICLLSGSSASLTHRLPAEHSLEPCSGLQGVSESPGSPSTSEYCVGSDKSPGSPSHPHSSLLSKDHGYLKNQAPKLPFEGKDLQLSQLILRRASEGVLQPQNKKMVREELGGSLVVLPGGGGPPLEQAAGGESNWSLSQSFEWSFPNQALEFSEKKLGSPPKSPIKEEEDEDALLEVELGRQSLSPKGSYEERGLDSQRRSGEEDEAYGSFPCLSDSRDSQRSERKKAEGELEFPTALEVSAPGGPSIQMEPTSPKLKGPLMALPGGCQEEHDDFLPLVTTPKEGALEAMEPLPSVEEAAPPAEHCILFSEDSQMQMAASCQEDDGALSLVEEGKMKGADPLRMTEPEPGSQWLDELLASPPPSADDTKKRGVAKSEGSTGPEDLLGWSQKDLHSEFGIVGAERSASFGMGWAADVGKVAWLGETEQDREFGTGAQDWFSSYTASDAKRQDMEFGAKPQDWTGRAPLESSSNAGQEDWLTTYGGSCTDQKIEEPDWSSTYSISTAECQKGEPYTRKPGWPKLCSIDDNQESSKFADEKMSWNSQYHVSTTEKTDWPNKYNEENASRSELEISTKSSDESSKYDPDSHQDTELHVRHSDKANDYSAVSVAFQDVTSSSSQSCWPGELSVDSGANQVHPEFSAQQVEQLSEYSANHPESQVITQQRLRPNTYGFDDSSCQESELGVTRSDWHSRYDGGIAQSRDDFSIEKPDGASEYDDQTGWARELGIENRGSATEFEAGDLDFSGRKPVWTDDYSLSETDVQGSDFPVCSRQWARHTDFSETEQKKKLGVIGKDQTGSFGPLELPSLRVSVDLEDTSCSLMDQAGDLITVAVGEPRGVGEGQPEWTRDLGLRGMDLSSDLKVGSPDASKKSTEKQPHLFPSLGLETLSATSDARTLTSEETREPGVGQADLAYRFSSESMEASGLRPKAVDRAEEVGQAHMDWTGATGEKHKDHSSQFEAAGLDSDEKQLPGATGDSRERKFRSQRLSSPSCLLEEISNNAVKEVALQKRPASFHSCHSEEEKGLSSLCKNQELATERTRNLPLPAEEDEKALSAVDVGDNQLDGGNWNKILVEPKESNYPERNGSQATQPMSQESHASEGTSTPTKENFVFIEDTEVLDNTVYRDRANLGRKRGHRAPATRLGGALSESDRDSWMFRDSTEPRTVSAVSDEEAPEEPKSRKSRASPLSKGVKVPLFPGLNPSALKAKLRGRNRSAEEGDPQSEAKETHVQRSRSCKITNTSGKPLVLPPKPEKPTGTETSSPNWLQILKLKKKKP